MHTITKEFSFVYGHRLWNQTVPPCACRRLHGHNGTLRFSLTSPELSNGMVVDFGVLKDFKQKLDERFDHRFFIDLHDPLLHHLLQLHDCHLNNTFRVDRAFEKEYVQELFDSLIVVPFTPTAEELSKFFCQYLNDWLKAQGHSCVCVKCELFETINSVACYELTTD